MDPVKKASFGTETFTPDRLVVSSQNLRHEKVVLAGGAAHQRGEALGKVTADGKYKLAAAAAGDGSETPTRILVHDVDATGGDTEALVYYTGDFDAASIILGAGLTVADVKEGLRDRGIFLHTALEA